MCRGHLCPEHFLDTLDVNLWRELARAEAVSTKHLVAGIGN